MGHRAGRKGGAREDGLESSKAIGVRRTREGDTVAHPRDCAVHLTRLSVERYKCFAERQDIEIRPLTLLIGRNSSGKSVLARLPLLLRHALSGQSVAPLDLEVGDVSFGGSFVDLVHGRFRHGDVGLGFRVENEPGLVLDWWVEVQHIDERKLQVIKRLDIESGPAEALHLAWSTIGDPTRPYYDIRDGGMHPITFNGIAITELPGVFNSDGELTFTDQQQAFLLGAPIWSRPAFEPIRYMGPFRQTPRREYGYPGGPLRDVGKGGALAPEVLGGDAAQQERQILDAVAGFYETHLGGWRLDVEERGDRFSLIVRSPGKDDTAINLVDAGVGLSQVLPLVVQRHLDSTAGNSSGIEIIEQPELHLHPAAHAALADLYVDAIKPRPCPRFIIETHSENFLLRIRRRIAEEQISADDVALYWIDDSSEEGSRAQRISIDANGDVDHWPRGVFSEDFEEVKAMRRAQQRRSP